MIKQFISLYEQVLAKYSASNFALPRMADEYALQQAFQSAFPDGAQQLIDYLYLNMSKRAAAAGLPCPQKPSAQILNTNIPLDIFEEPGFEKSFFMRVHHLMGICAASAKELQHRLAEKAEDSLLVQASDLPTDYLASVIQQIEKVRRAHFLQEMANLPIPKKTLESPSLLGRLIGRPFKAATSPQNTPLTVDGFVKSATKCPDGKYVLTIQRTPVYAKNKGEPIEVDLPETIEFLVNDKKMPLIQRGDKIVAGPVSRRENGEIFCQTATVLSNAALRKILIERPSIHKNNLGNPHIEMIDFPEMSLTAHFDILSLTRQDSEVIVAKFIGREALASGRQVVVIQDKSGDYKKLLIHDIEATRALRTGDHFMMFADFRYGLGHTLTNNIIRLDEDTGADLLSLLNKEAKKDQKRGAAFAYARAIARTDDQDGHLEVETSPPQLLDPALN